MPRYFSNPAEFIQPIGQAQQGTDLLSSLIQGAQQGVALRQLPQQLQSQQIAQQLANAINQQKLYDLQNPEQALARKVAQELAIKGALNPDLGIQQAPTGLTGETIFNPGALTQDQQASLPSPQLLGMRDAAANQGGVTIPQQPLPHATAAAPTTPISILGAQTGLTLNPNIPDQARANEAAQKIDLATQLAQIKSGQATDAQVRSFQNQRDIEQLKFEQSKQLHNEDAAASAKLAMDLLDKKIAGGVAGNTGTASYYQPSDVERDVQDVLEGKNSVQDIRIGLGRSDKAGEILNRIRRGLHQADPEFDYVSSNGGSKFISSTYFNRSISAIDSVLPNIDKIIELQKQVPQGDVKALNSLIQKVGLQFGSTKVTSLKAAQQIIGDELGNALGNGTGSDLKVQLGIDVTDPTVPEDAFVSKMEFVKTALTNRKNGLNARRYVSSTVSPQQPTSSSTAVPPGMKKQVNTKTGEIRFVPQ